MGLEIAGTTERGLLDYVFAALARGEGGWIVTANLDFLRRFAIDERARSLYASADIRVADGMPLVWASRVAGDPLPERIAGSNVVDVIARRAAAEGRSLFLLGGEGDSAMRAADVFRTRSPSLRIAGIDSPRISSPITNAELEPIVDSLARAQPDIVLLAFGSPKQEYLAERLRSALPRAWHIGVGASFAFVAGTLQRAPKWMQRAGLEWTHRLASEPSRLARRYLLEDLPFAVRLFGSAAIARVRRSRSDRP